MRTDALSLLVLSALFGCGAVTEPADHGPNGSSDEPLPIPSLVAIGPGAIALGQSIRVVGENFVPAERAAMSLHMQGVYTTDLREAIRFEGDLPLTYVN